MSSAKLPEIIYQDQYLIAINKPPGLLVHRSSIDPNETCFAVSQVRDCLGQHVYPVHRLDRPTSGVLLFALTPPIARKVSKLFQTRQIKKTYMAVVRGYTDLQGIIDHALKPVKDRYAISKTKSMDIKHPAFTRYLRLATIELPYAVDKYSTSRYSLVSLLPGTGRRHQLRRHMKHISHPIIGDTIYGKGKHNQFFRDRFNCADLLLCATSLEFKHPVTQTDTCITANLSQTFSHIISCFAWDKFF